jgi:hypothetical protein
MDPQTEATAMADVQARLAERFPTVAVEVVEAAVRVAHSAMTGPVRDFVPILVEHSARDRLAALVREQSAGQSAARAAAALPVTQSV